MASAEADPAVTADTGTKPADAKRAGAAPEGGAKSAAAGGTVIVDATDHIAGRLASSVAKLLLQGKRVHMVNCERIMISGSRANIVGEYRKFLEIASVLHPKHGPFHPRRPDTIMTRMVRGMLPRKKPSGIAAHKRLRAHIGTPRALRSQKKVQFEKAKIRGAHSRYTSMADLGRTVGWT